MAPVSIVATGSYGSDEVLTNDDLETMVDTTDEWILQRTGIKERRIAGAPMSTSDLAEKASGLLVCFWLQASGLMKGRSGSSNKGCGRQSAWI